MDLRLLLIEQPDQLVVLLDGLKRLDKHRLARRRRAMNDAGNLPLELRLDRDDEAVAANGDQLVLRAAAVGEARAGYLRRLSSMARCCRSMARRMRRSSGEASSLRLPSGSILPRNRRSSGRSHSRAAARRGQQYPASRSGHRRTQARPDCATQPPARRRRAGRGSRSPQARAGDARLIEQQGRVKQAPEVEAPAASEHAAQLRGALLLLVDPASRRRVPAPAPGATERRERMVSNMVAEPRPLQRRGTGLAKRRRNNRK